ncbi:hypothetical protein PFISCL1PPCAC_17095, partial [Pristionchus fissidentatus]
HPWFVECPLPTSVLHIDCLKETWLLPRVFPNSKIDSECDGECRNEGDSNEERLVIDNEEVLKDENERMKKEKSVNEEID